MKTKTMNAVFRKANHHLSPNASLSIKEELQEQIIKDPTKRSETRPSQRMPHIGAGPPL